MMAIMHGIIDTITDEHWSSKDLIDELMNIAYRKPHQSGRGMPGGRDTVL